MNETRAVAILIFDDVEVLDFCGPFEVFSVASSRCDPPPFRVYTVASRAGPVIARNDLSVNPDFSLENCPPPDLLIVPGGQGTRPLLKDTALLDWLREQDSRCELTLSVCTGSLLLAQAGLLEGLRATTHWGSLDLLASLAPSTRVLDDVRYVDNGGIITSAGISAGIDMSLHVVERLLGSEHAARTARHMEYDYWPEGRVNQTGERQ
ncbi:MAG: DJ-1/PfpI family protein [Anaerolineaceae bacterium]|nr:DJ-1/PfpI family protein [Anaerolineaceae bacterium]